jgi:hypothetical protein
VSDDSIFYDPMMPPSVFREPTDMFITNLKEGATLMRLIAPLGDPRYIGVRYHWDVDGRRSYPCLAKTAPNGMCIGCASTNPETRKQKNRVIVPALDADGTLRLFSYPQGLFGDLIAVAEEVVGDDESVVDYMTKVQQSREGSGPVKYRIYLKLTNAELPDVAITAAQIKESLRNEYIRSLSTLHPELGASLVMEEDDGWSEAEVAAPPKEEVRKVVRRGRPPKAKAKPEPVAESDDPGF